MDDSWKIQQHLVLFLLVAHSMTGEQVAHELLTVLTTELHVSIICIYVSTLYLLAVMHDRVSVNSVTVSTLQIVY